MDPKGLATFTASRLIAIDKQPGVRPIAIGEVVRRIISKAILAVVKTDIMEITGSIQLCAGQDSSCEAAVHAMRVYYRMRVQKLLCWWMPRMLSTALTDS